MLPLGIVNLVAVAVLLEYGQGMETWVLIACNWAVAIVAWLATAAAAPLIADNRPRIGSIDG